MGSSTSQQMHGCWQTIVHHGSIGPSGAQWHPTDSTIRHCWGGKGMGRTYMVPAYKQALLVEDEQIELQRNICPVKLVLLKVRWKHTNAPWFLTPLQAVKARIQTYPLHIPLAAYMAQNTCWLAHDSHQYATRCLHPLEVNFRYAGLCPCALGGNWHGDSMLWPGIAQVWACR